MIPPQLLQTQDQVLIISKLAGYGLYLFRDDNGVFHVVSSDPSPYTVISDVLNVHSSQLPELDEYEIISWLLTKPYMYRRVSFQVDPLYKRCYDFKLAWLYIFNWLLPSNSLLAENG